MPRRKHAIALLLTITSIITYSQEIISENEKNATIESIKELIHTNYVFANQTNYFNNSLDSLYVMGKYDAIKDYTSFSEILTNDLVEITKDKHFKIQYNPEFVKYRRERLKRQQQDNTINIDNNTEEEEKKEEIDWDFWYAQKENNYRCHHGICS